jgi:hypothetical protein
MRETRLDARSGRAVEAISRIGVVAGSRKEISHLHGVGDRKWRGAAEKEGRRGGKEEQGRPRKWVVVRFLVCVTACAATDSALKFSRD